MAAGGCRFLPSFLLHCPEVPLQVMLAGTSAGCHLFSVALGKRRKKGKEKEEQFMMSAVEVGQLWPLLLIFYPVAKCKLLASRPTVGLQGSPSLIHLF